MAYSEMIVNIEETRAEQNDKKEMVITGVAAVFEKLSVPLWGFKEKIRRSAFSKSLEKNNVKALWNHNRDFVLGSTKSGTLKVKENEKGLPFEVVLPDSEWGRSAYESIKRGDVDQMSFGFNVIGQEWDESDPKNIIRTLTEVDLHEISFTAFPAYKQTSAKTRSIKEEYQDYKKESEDPEIEKRKNELDIKMKLLELEQ